MAFLNNYIKPKTDADLIRQFLDFIREKKFPCIAAKAAVAKQQVSCMVAGDMSESDDDARIVNFVYDFVDRYRQSNTLFHSAAVIFRKPVDIPEEHFDNLLWTRLQAFADIDSAKYPYDSRVSNDIGSSHFSFSLKSEAHFVICLHPSNSRLMRRFSYPVIIFNPHQQFEELRGTNTYELLKNAVRKRDMRYSGSTNPMLDDFGSSSEVTQYSGRVYDKSWKCPLKSHHGKS